LGRRGPKAKQGKREPNGRASRKPDDVVERHLKTLRELDAEQRETMRSGVSARMRLYGVSVEASLDQMAGSFVGRLRLAGEITQAQYEASQTYLEECRNNSIVVCSPRQPGAVDLNATHGAGVGVENVAFAMRARALYEETHRAIQAEQNRLKGTAMLFGALNLCVLDDRPLPHLVPWLRLGLDVLVRRYRLDSDKGRVAA
jgi:hypothetical protein